MFDAPDLKRQEPPAQPTKPVKRWDRESWNAYMKGYMRKRRAKG